MKTIDDINQLNNIFYADREHRKIYLNNATEMITKVTEQLGFEPNKILALNRSWLSELLVSREKNITVLPATIDQTDRFDLILALDEVLTREADEVNQKKTISQLISFLKPGGVMLASLRDYRNTNCHRRPLGDTIFSQIGGDRYVVTEVNELDMNDKQRWFQKYHVVRNDTEFSCIEQGARRTLYFKQLAKYCHDANAAEFGSIKDGFWRNHLRRTPEHLIYARTR